MEAKDRLIVDFLDKKDDTFLIPAYQRKYKWKTNKEIKDLLHDLETFAINGEGDYFFGSVIVKTNPALEQKYILIDGQQRITTFLLIVAAIYYTIKNTPTKLKYKILSFLEIEHNKYKLKRIEHEDVVWKIFNDQVDTLTNLEKKTNCFKVFDFLFKKFKTMTLPEIQYFYDRAICKINIAIVHLDQEEDELLVFESINSKGSVLSATNLIKNYVMMQMMNSPKLEAFFENNFLPLFDTKELEDFYRQFLALKNGALSSKTSKNLYYAFKKAWPAKKITRNFLENIYQAALIWRYVNDANFSKRVNPLIKENINSYYLIIHALVKKQSIYLDRKLIVNYTNRVSIEKDLIKLSGVVIKRMLGGRKKNESNRAFTKVGFDYLNDRFKNIDQVITYLDKASGNTRTPTWEEVLTKAAQVKLYGTYKNTLKQILIAIEEQRAQAIVDEEEIELEHIFPIKPSLDWKVDYIEKEKMHKVINTLGNLSIASPYSVLGNKMFKLKDDMLDNKTYLKVNRYIYQSKKWDAKAINDRTYKLLSEIQTMWS